MGLLDRLLGRTTRVSTGRDDSGPVDDRGRPSAPTRPRPPGAPPPSEERWYVPADGDGARFVGQDGAPPPLHLIDYRSGGESVLRLCEDSTGLLVGPTDRRLARAGIYVSNLRGESYHPKECKAGDFGPGQPVRLIREPDNAYDPNAVAVTADRARAQPRCLRQQGQGKHPGQVSRLGGRPRRREPAWHSPW